MEEDHNYQPEQTPPTPAPRMPGIRYWMGKMRLSRVLRWAMLILISGWLAANWYGDLPVHELAQRYGSPDSKFVEIDGLLVHYRITGKGEPLVLLHDANNSLHTWDTWTDTLSRRYQIISLDLPGFGLTGPHPQGSYSAFMYANFFESFVQAINLRRFHLAGNGLGAQIAWFYATEHPGRLRKLILLNAPGFEEKKEPIVSFLARTPVLNRALWNITPRFAIRLMLENMYADDQKVDDALVSRHHDLMRRPGNRKAFTARASVSENRPPVDIIEEITTLILILWGAEDTRISPEYAYEFHRKIRKALLKIYQNTGHWPQEENPGETAADVQAFLEGRF
ncbi:MAG: alpha/beta hydrolase [Lewinellaceae bacterium]|nr:alpha/beta hydrolase [Lewinellaceae bacterium]